VCALRAIPRTDSETPKEKEPHLFNDVVAIDTFLRHRFLYTLLLLFSVKKKTNKSNKTKNKKRVG
jgi:hypothetical protein